MSALAVTYVQLMDSCPCILLGIGRGVHLSLDLAQHLLAVSRRIWLFLPCGRHPWQHPGPTHSQIRSLPNCLLSLSPYEDLTWPPKQLMLVLVLAQPNLSSPGSATKGPGWGTS